MSILRVKLAQHRGQLPEIARISGVTYYLVQRMARGDYPHSPTLRTIDALLAACDAIAPPARKSRRRKG